MVKDDASGSLPYTVDLQWYWGRTHDTKATRGVARTELGASRVSHPCSQPDEPDCSTAAALVNFLGSSDEIGITDPNEYAKRKHAHSVFLSQLTENLSVLPDRQYGLPLPFKFEKPSNQIISLLPLKGTKECLKLYPIGPSSDIEKAFLQLNIIPEHRDYLRFFLPTVKETKIYRHCRVVFGESVLLPIPTLCLHRSSPGEFHGPF
ncbi:putative RNA-directed DNA polymerase from transposon X-element [Trichonephila clavipes]|nr:putative RNA-directed DNA polymerase from transposon X-element [Trichonephila clavipes]